MLKLFASASGVLLDARLNLASLFVDKWLFVGFCRDIFRSRPVPYNFDFVTETMDEGARLTIGSCTSC